MKTSIIIKYSNLLLSNNKHIYGLEGLLKQFSTDATKSSIISPGSLPYSSWNLSTAFLNLLISDVMLPVLVLFIIDTVPDTDSTTAVTEARTTAISVKLNPLLDLFPHSIRFTTLAMVYTSTLSCAICTKNAPKIDFLMSHELFILLTEKVH